MNIYTFNTRNFTISVDAEPELNPDLSWDDSGEIWERLESGELECFTAVATVAYRGCVIASDYLGDCIYESPKAFRDHLGIRKQGPNVGSYFSDMVRQVCKEARDLGRLVSSKWEVAA